MSQHARRPIDRVNGYLSARRYAFAALVDELADRRLIDLDRYLGRLTDSAVENRITDLGYAEALDTIADDIMNLRSGRPLAEI